MESDNRAHLKHYLAIHALLMSIQDLVEVLSPYDKTATRVLGSDQNEFQKYVGLLGDVVVDYASLAHRIAGEFDRLAALHAPKVAPPIDDAKSRESPPPPMDPPLTELRIEAGGHVRIVPEAAKSYLTRGKPDEAIMRLIDARDDVLSVIRGAADFLDSICTYNSTVNYGINKHSAALKALSTRLTGKETP